MTLLKAVDFDFDFGSRGRMICERVAFSGVSVDAWGWGCVEADVLIVERERRRGGM